MSYPILISQFVFLLHKNNHDILKQRLDHLLYRLKQDFSNTETHTYLKTLYLLVVHVRDIYFGHGMRDLSYMMILLWYHYFPVLGIYALHQFFVGSVVGSWNDVKYFAKYLFRNGHEDHPLLKILVSLANRQLKYDYQHFLNGKTFSNVCKWIPREKKMPEFFKMFVCDWVSRKQVFSGDKKSYRNIISKLNKYFSSLPITNKNIFRSIAFSQYPSDIVSYKPVYFHGNMFAGDYVRSAICILKHHYLDTYDISFDSHKDVDWIQTKWKKLLHSFLPCKPIIPVVDMSVHISDADFFHSIGLAILIASVSTSYRILFVSNIPIWIDIGHKESFCSIVCKIWSFAQYRSKSNFDCALSLLREGITHSGESSCVFVIFSQDFSFDLSGFESCRVILWNIGFSSSDCLDLSLLNPNVFLFSGCSPALLSFFFSDNADFSNGTYGFLRHYLCGSPYGRYDILCRYFDIFVSST